MVFLFLASALKLSRTNSRRNAEDELPSGTIADNICFFDSGFDHQRMFQCAQIAGIHDDLIAMPMNYNSLVGDMGSCLSSGQKQRVLLARALYHQPKILFVDEGTAHVNVEMESQIYDNLGSLKLTMICIAHRPGVLAYSDKVFRFEGGTVVLISAPKSGSLRRVSPASGNFQHFNRGPFCLFEYKPKNLRTFGYEVPGAPKLLS
jgi:ABC-type bacteriocin/lantibiotic exporter with double-glycine peptidase domain